MRRKQLRTAVTGTIMNVAGLLVAPVSGVAALGSQMSPKSHAADPLTRRELEVATLIARERSDREIAKELVVALPIAERHVAKRPRQARLQFTNAGRRVGGPIEAVMPMHDNLAQRYVPVPVAPGGGTAAHVLPLDGAGMFPRGAIQPDPRETLSQGQTPGER